MQWLLYAATLLLMAILQRLTRGGPLEARATLTLGFLMLAAYLGGEVTRRLRLPRITGYIVTGLLVGPTWLRVVRADELQALSMVSIGALMLIAIAAGSSVTFRGLWEQRVPLGRIVAGAMLAPFLYVTLVLLTISPWFPVTIHQPFRDAVGVALVLGAVSAVSSPVISWAVKTDIGAEGPLARTVIATGITQDIVAVALVVVLVLLAQPVASIGSVTPGVAWDALLRLGGSVGAGAALGMVIAQYIKRLRHYVVWVLVAAAFVAAQSVRFIGFEPALIGLAAGCTIANAAPEENGALQTALEKCAFPAHVVFFALLGAGLRLEAITELWPWVLLLAGLRVVGLRVGMQWAGRHAAVSADIVSVGWLGLVSQGGLAITLALVLRRAFPEWGITLESLILATIGVHLIAGPICFQWALRRAGEAPVGAEGEGVHGETVPETAARGAALMSSSGGSGGGM